MRSLIFLDLMGTLLEASQVTNRGRVEYTSRIMFISRKLNTLLKNNVVVINTSIDHCELNDLYTILSDIDRYIEDDYRSRLHYYICCDYEESFTEESLYTSKNTEIKVVANKNIVYETLLDKFNYLFPIAVDDNPLEYGNLGFSMVYKKHGRLCIIHNYFNSKDISGSDRLLQRYKKRYYPYASSEEIINEFIHNNEITFNFSESELENFRESVYSDYKSGNISIKNLSFFSIKKGIKRYFLKNGFDQEEIDNSIEQGQICFVSSFEEAYQKILKYTI